MILDHTGWCYVGVPRGLGLLSRCTMLIPALR
jgi:hypothetical protein